jgi:hypothetical protein
MNLLGIGFKVGEFFINWLAMSSNYLCLPYQKWAEFVNDSLLKHCLLELGYWDFAI